MKQLLLVTLVSLLLFGCETFSGTELAKFQCTQGQASVMPWVSGTSNGMRFESERDGDIKGCATMDYRSTNCTGSYRSAGCN